MPQATGELQDAMQQQFGNPVDDAGPIKYLKEAGYILTHSWLWQPKPGVSSVEDMTQDEFNCLAFLVQEWDFGGLQPPQGDTT